MGRAERLWSGEGVFPGEAGDPVYEANLKRITEANPEERQCGFLIPVDMIEQEGHVVIWADLPGLSREEVTVWLEGRVLTIEGQYPPAGEGGRVFFRERYSGLVRRSLVLPTGLDGAHFTVTMQNGLLKVCVPRQGRPAHS